MFDLQYLFQRTHIDVPIVLLVEEVRGQQLAKTIQLIDQILHSFLF